LYQADFRTPSRLRQTLKWNSACIRKCDTFVNEEAGMESLTPYSVVFVFLLGSGCGALLVAMQRHTQTQRLRLAFQADLEAMWERFSEQALDPGRAARNPQMPVRAQNVSQILDEEEPNQFNDCSEGATTAPGAVVAAGTGNHVACSHSSG
jgi:hypothetical protein